MLLSSPVVSVRTRQWYVNCPLGKLGVLGFEVDHERNLAARFGKSGFINKEGTRPAIVIPTNEELVIAQDAHRLTA